MTLGLAYGDVIAYKAEFKGKTTENSQKNIPIMITQS